MRKILMVLFFVGTAMVKFIDPSLIKNASLFLFSY